MTYHYVYRITNKRIRKHYYGARTSRIEPKFDLGIVYFSSSTNELFLMHQKYLNTDFKYKIIKTFKTKEAAIAYEHYLHNKFNVAINNNFYSDNITFTQGKQNRIIKKMYDILTKIEDNVLMNNPCLLDMKYDIEKNILNKSCNIIHLSNDKITKFKNFLQYFIIDNDYISKINIINSVIKNYTKNSDIFNSTNRNKIKKDIKFIFYNIFNDYEIDISDKIFRRKVYEYITYLIYDVELYDYKYKYGVVATNKLNELLELKNTVKNRLEYHLEHTIPIIKSNKQKLNLKKSELYDEIHDKILEDFLGNSQRLNNLLNCNNEEFSESIDAIEIKYVICMIYYDVICALIKYFKSALSSKTANYDELFL